MDTWNTGTVFGALDLNEYCSHYESQVQYDGYENVVHTVFKFIEDWKEGCWLEIIRRQGREKKRYE